MIFEYCEGGDLFDRVVAKSKYTEEEGRLVMKQLLEALRYLHEEARVMHRDITPENIYLPSGEKLVPFRSARASSLNMFLCTYIVDSDVNVKLAHFTFSRRLSDADTRPCCGTPSYVAPEILRREAYGVECDIWRYARLAVNVCTTLCCGFPEVSA
jgi:serine/threonine protein kinase